MLVYRRPPGEAGLSFDGRQVHHNGHDEFTKGTTGAAPVPVPHQAPVPAPPIQCGRGPAAFPKSFPLISERILPTSAAVTEAKKGVWPFIVG